MKNFYWIIAQGFILGGFYGIVISYPWSWIVPVFAIIIVIPQIWNIK
jgi:hypothetical protein